MATACVPATRPYMRLRRLLRNPLSLWLLRHLPLAKRQALGRKLRKQSQLQTRQKAASIIDVTPSEVSRLMAKYGVRTLIHGHTHRPARHPLEINGQSAQRIVLGDWDQQGWGPASRREWLPGRALRPQRLTTQRC